MLTETYLARRLQVKNSNDSIQFQILKAVIVLNLSSIFAQGQAFFVPQICCWSVMSVNHDVGLSRSQGRASSHHGRPPVAAAWSRPTPQWASVQARRAGRLVVFKSTIIRRKVEGKGEDLALGPIRTSRAHGRPCVRPCVRLVRIGL